MSQLIVGVFTDPDHAEMAVSELEKNDYNPKDISIIMKDRDEGKKMAARTGADVGAGTMSGATTGGVIGALAGLLVAAGVVPGLGALFVAGPLISALGLTGAAATTLSGAATGAIAGGIVGLLGGLGIAGKDAAEYEESIRQGGIFVAVPTGKRDMGDARAILESHGAQKIRAFNTDDAPRRSEHRGTAHVSA